MFILNWVCLFSFCALIYQIMFNLCKAAVLDINSTKKVNKRVKQVKDIQPNYYMQKIAR